MFRFLILFFLIILPNPGAYAGGMSVSSDAGSQSPSAVSSGTPVASAIAPGQAPHRFIVRFKRDGPAALNEDAEELIKSKRKFQDAVADRSDSIDQLNAVCRIQGARGMFHRRQGVNLTQARMERQQFRKNILQKFLRRAARAAVLDTEDLSNVYVFDVDSASPLTVEEICKKYQADPHVEFAQPDYVAQSNLIPNDTSYNSLWAMKKIQAEPAWDLAQGENTIVGVVDTGLDATHLDIAANVWTNPNEVPGNGLDDDGNGYVDDVHGYDFTRCAHFNEGSGFCDSSKNRDNNPNDENGHGTHVSGTIAAVGNNARGVIGVAPQAKVLPAQALNAQGSGYISDLAEAIAYAAENGADVINNSWGTSDRVPSSPVAEAAVRYAYGLGAVVVFAAGNNNDDVQYYSPANMAETVAVAASDSGDNKASFSNYGSLIDVAAPGVSILSTVPGNGYAYYQGTSMAAPHVSGLAAMVLSNQPALTHIEIRQIIRNSSDDIGSPGFDNLFGYGRINAAKALNVPDLVSFIDSPANNALIDPQSNSVNISGTAWGRNFKQYQLFYRRAEDSVWLAINAPVTVPVHNGLLGTWDFGALSPGNYLLRLWVVSVSATDSEHVIPVTLFEKGTVASPVRTQAVTTGDVTFQWNPGYGVSEYALAVATDPRKFWTPPYGDIYFQSVGMLTTAQVTGIPLNGQLIYVQLASRVGNTWYYDNTAYQMGRAAQIIFPTEDLIVAATAGTIYWDPGIGATEFALGAGTTSTAVSSYPWGDISLQLNLNTTQANVSGIVLNGQRLYLRLWSKVGANWLYKDYNYQLAKPAEMVFPTEGMVVSVPAGTVYWNSGIQATEYALGLGTSQAAVSVFGGGDISFQSGLTATNAAVSGIPLNGSWIYLRLWSKISGQWYSKDYSYLTSH